MISGFWEGAAVRTCSPFRRFSQRTEKAPVRDSHSNTSGTLGATPQQLEN